MKAGDKVIHHKPEYVGITIGGSKATHHYVNDDREVRIMAIAEGYAMVRRKGAIPYVALLKELESQACVLKKEKPVGAKRGLKVLVGNEWMDASPALKKTVADIDRALQRNRIQE